MYSSSQNFDTLLGAKLQEMRQAKKLTLDEILKHTHLSISRSSLSAIENGTQEISAKDLHALSSVLRFSLDELLSDISREILLQKFSVKLNK